MTNDEIMDKLLKSKALTPEEIYILVNTPRCVIDKTNKAFGIIRAIGDKLKAADPAKYETEYATLVNIALDYICNAGDLATEQMNVITPTCEELICINDNKRTGRSS